PQLLEHLRKVLAVGAAPAQGPGGEHIGAWCTSQSEIDTTGVEWFQRAELFGDLQWRMVGQHDAPGADANALGSGRQIADDHRGGGTGDTDHVVMLGYPEPVIAH